MVMTTVTHALVATQPAVIQFSSDSLGIADTCVSGGIFCSRILRAHAYRARLRWPVRNRLFSE